MTTVCIRVPQSELGQGRPGHGHLRHLRVSRLQVGDGPPHLQLCVVEALFHRCGQESLTVFPHGCPTFSRTVAVVREEEHWKYPSRMKVPLAVM